MSNEERVGRRDFLKFAIMGMGGLISTIMAIPAVAFLIGPALKKVEDQNWIAVGTVSKVEIGTPTLFKAKIQRQAGWILDEQELSFYILTNDGRDFVAMSNICTHLGCRVRWVSSEETFFCPCHNAAFDKEGAVASGPPPRALDRYEVKVEDNQLFVLGG